MAKTLAEELASSGLTMDDVRTLTAQQEQAQQPANEATFSGPDEKSVTVTQASAPPQPKSFREALSQAGMAPEKLFDTTGEVRPKYANGLSPQAPIPVSPLTPEERLSMAGGNKKGAEQYLKSKFEAVTKDESGNFLVRDKGFWHKVDGEAFGDADAWETTKSIAKGFLASAQVLGDKLLGRNPVAKGRDLATQGMLRGDSDATEVASEITENAPGAVAFGASIGAGILTGGTSLLTQATAAGITAGSSELLRTSWGRAEGTYEATPEEQLVDVGTEAVLNFAGVYAGAGMKMGADKVGEAIAKSPLVRKGIKVSDDAIEGVKGLYSSLTGRNGDAVDTLMKHGKEVSMQLRSRKGYQSDGAFIEAKTEEMLQDLAGASELLADLPSAMYKKQQSQILASVGDDFVGGAADTVDDALSHFVQNGMVTLESKGTLLTDGLGNAAWKKDAAPKMLNVSEALGLLGKNNGKLPSGYRFKLLSREEMLKFAGQTGDMKTVAGAIDDQSYKSLADLVEKLSSVRNVKALRGKQGAEQLLELNRILSDTTWKLSAQADDQAMKHVQRQVGAVHDILKGSIENKFKVNNLGEQFTAMNAKFSEAASQLKPVIDAVKESKYNGLQAYQKLATKLGARPGKQVVAKGAMAGNKFEALLRDAETMGIESLGKIREHQLAVQIKQSAIEFTPRFDKGTQGIFSKAGGIASLGFLATGNPAPAIAIGAGAIATSPRASMRAIQLLQSAKQFKDMTTRLGAEGASQLLTRPELLLPAVSAVVESPMIQEGVKEQLMTPVRGPGGGQ